MCMSPDWTGSNAPAEESHGRNATYFGEKAVVRKWVGGLVFSHQKGGKNRLG